ncbi:hypothetical protein CAP36_16210 [Chitinophagaceae bacterium IBVUCB2]|nr:hypothetical protein CAP36_16210 [Chitinophagaceae bacterium IBVUCB2]
MSGAKIRLSEKEMELVTNAEVILTKNAIIEKVKTLMAELQSSTEEIINQHSYLFAPEAILSRPKISRGENYKGLPYLILDYPRCFEKKNILAIRTMFWWGNFFSITLHLSGKYKELYQQKIIAAFDMIIAHELFIGIHEDQWEHHFEKDNYTAVNDFSAIEFSQIIREQGFLKLAKKIPLTQWDDAKNILLEAYSDLLKLLKD